MSDNTFNILNDSSTDRTIFIEPWGEELRVKSRACLHVKSSLPLCDLTFHDEGIAIHFDPDAGIQVVDVDTKNTLIAWDESRL